MATLSSANSTSTVTVLSSNVKYYSDVAKNYMNEATIQAAYAKEYASDAAASADEAETSAEAAAESAAEAAASAEAAAASEANAAASETNAESYADLAKDWAIKTDDTVDGEEYSAKYYAEYTQSMLEDLVTEDELTAALAEKANTADLAAVATSGSYTDLSNTPSNVSEFTNDSGYLTAVPDEYVTETELTEAISNIDTSGISVDLSDYYTKDETDTALSAKQDTLTFDTAPTEDSTNPVTSGGIYTAIVDNIASLEEEFDSMISNAFADVDVSRLNIDMSDYYTKTETDAAIVAAIEEAIGNVESSSY